MARGAALPFPPGCQRWLAPLFPCPLSSAVRTRPSPPLRTVRRRMRLQLDFTAWASHPAAHATLLGTECLTRGTVGARAGGAWRAADALCSPVCVFVWLCRLRCSGHVSPVVRHESQLNVSSDTN
eukprot:scaffold54676_cov45-Phaeocystis_antarctica.AAC.3